VATTAPCQETKQALAKAEAAKEKEAATQVGAIVREQMSNSWANKSNILIVCVAAQATCWTILPNCLTFVPWGYCRAFSFLLRKSADFQCTQRQMLLRVFVCYVRSKGGSTFATKTTETKTQIGKQGPQKGAHANYRCSIVYHEFN
jgi:hypothetical protein